MSIEDRIRAELPDTLDQLRGWDLPGDLGAVVRAGSGIRRTRRAIAAGSALAVVAAAVVAVTLVGRPDRAASPDPAPAPTTTPAPTIPPQPSGWRRLPQAPLSARSSSLAARAGTEAVFIGGYQDDPSNGGDPAKLVDGAAYDLATGTWRSIADAPVALAREEGTTVKSTGEDVVVHAGVQWLDYDAGDDTWTRLPAPPEKVQPYTSFSTLEGHAYAIAGSDDVLDLDVDAASWSVVPPDDLTPAPGYVDTVVGVPGGVAVSLTLNQKQSDDDYRTWVDVYDGTSWRRLATGQYRALSQWTGTRLIEPNLDPIAKRGMGRVPGAGTLDLTTGRWTELTDLPSGNASFEGYAGEGPLALVHGQLYDDDTGHWTEVRLPQGGLEYPAGTVLVDGTIVVFGGLTDRSSDLVDDAWAWHA